MLDYIVFEMMFQGAFKIQGEVIQENSEGIRWEPNTKEVFRTWKFRVRLHCLFDKSWQSKHNYLSASSQNSNMTRKRFLLKVETHADQENENNIRAKINETLWIQQIQECLTLSQLAIFILIIVRLFDSRSCPRTTFNISFTRTHLNKMLNQKKAYMMLLSNDYSLYSRLYCVKSWIVYISPSPNTTYQMGTQQ